MRAAKTVAQTVAQLGVVAIASILGCAGSPSEAGPQSSTDPSPSTYIAATCPCLTEMCCGSIEACAMNPQCGELIDCFENGNPAACVPPGGQPVIDCFVSQCGFAC